MPEEHFREMGKVTKLSNQIGIWCRRDQPYVLSNYHWYTWGTLKQKHVQQQLEKGLRLQGTMACQCYPNSDAYYTQSNAFYLQNEILFSE